MQHRVLYDKAFFETLLLYFTVNVTRMFRDPLFYKALREEVIPVLKRQPHIKIWHAGCATGEEDLYNKSRIFATYMNQKVLETAAEAYAGDLVGIFMSGANSDGKNGLRKIKESGGMAIVQDPETAPADVMPKAAIKGT